MKNNIISMLLFLFVTMLCAMGTVFYLQFEDSKINESKVEMQTLIDLTSGEVSQFIKSHFLDTVMLSHTPPIENILKLRNNIKGSKSIGTDEDIWRERLQIIFTAMLKAKNEFIQLRFLNVHGDELVRVDANTLRKIYKIKELQNKSESHYFKKALELKADETLISDVGFNKEYNKITIEKPIIRIVTPIYNSSFTNEGFIIINLKLTVLLSHLKEIIGDKKILLVANSNHELIYSSNKVKDMAFARGESYKVNDFFKELESNLSEKPKENILFGDKYLFLRKEVKFLDIFKGPSIYLYAGISKGNIYTSISDALIRSILITLFLIFIILILCLIWIKKITSPLEELTVVAENFGDGDQLEENEIHIEEPLEIKVLNKALKKMMKQIVSRRKVLVETNLHMEQILEELKYQKFATDEHSIVATTDSTGKIIYANEKFIQISQYSQEELIGSTHAIVKSGYHNTDFFKNMWEVISSGNVWKGEIKNKKKYGGYYWVDSTIVPFKNENKEITQYIAIRTDITEKKLSESLLIEAKEQAETANLSKSNFISNMSHEIRTPLNVMLGNVDLIELNRNELSTENRECFKGIREASRILKEVVGNILDISKIEMGKLEAYIEIFDYKTLFKGIYHMHKSSAEKKALLFSYKISDNVSQYINGDRTFYNIILMNLTSNAIKFTDKNKSICMSTYIENNKLIISVEDEGIGVEKENQERIFSIFEQEDNSIRRKFGGTGLGLALLKSVVEEMQGSIDLESKVGHGSTFIITLPYFPKKRGDSEQSFLLGTPAKGINILVIEDNVLNQDILKNVLLKFSANVEIANNGNEGLQMLNEQTDIIFSDLHMPECDGYQFLEKIKPFKEKYHDIPIYIFTADIQEEIKQKCLNLGAKGFLKKPLSLSSIKGILIEEFPQDKTKHQSNDMINLKEVNEKLSECMIKLKSIDFLEKEIMGDAISLALDIAVEYNLIDLIDELESLEEISLGDKQDTYFIKIEYIENIIKKSN